MFFVQFLQNPIGAIFFIVSIIIAVTVHEFAHAKVADRLGDPTPGLQGRVTLDPRSHLDPLGSLLFLFIGFGWGKPVPFDPFNLDNPKRDAALIALAGPVSNYIMAIVGSILIQLMMFFELSFSLSIGLPILSIFIWINIVLGTFNLLPFAPLDGFKIVGGLLSNKQAAQWYSLERYGIIFLMFFIFPFAGGRSMLDTFLVPLVRFIVGILIPSGGIL